MVEVGKRYNGLVCVGKDPDKDERYYLFRCDCGNITSIIAYNVERGATTSCGCKRKRMLDAGEMRRKHGGKGTRLYGIWKSMRERCNTLSSSNYHKYGGRGIRVCEDWTDFVNFEKWAVCNGYADNLTIDRIDNNGNYEPSNCRWTTYQEQNNNRRSNVYLTYQGETKTLTQWAREKGIKPGTLCRRLKVGWTIEDALGKST